MENGAIYIILGQKKILFTARNLIICPTFQSLYSRVIGTRNIFSFYVQCFSLPCIGIPEIGITGIGIPGIGITGLKITGIGITGFRI